MDRACRADSHGAVDHRQPGLEEADVPGDFADEVRDLEWDADVHHVDGVATWPRLAGDVDADSRSPRTTDQLQERRSYFPKPDNHGATHDDETSFTAEDSTWQRQGGLDRRLAFVHDRRASGLADRPGRSPELRPQGQAMATTGNVPTIRNVPFLALHMLHTS